jgi:hypothetical protein
MRFTAKVDFWSDAMQSQYIAGLSYTVREGNEKLAAEVTKWIADGKVEPGGPAARVQGGE